MMTPKEALVKDGTIAVKDGRGRMSKEAVERIKWLVINKGWDIKNYPKPESKPAQASRAVSEPVEVKRVADSSAKDIRDFHIFYPEESFQAVGLDKKVWSMREVCNICRVSLVQNSCPSPKILGDIPVKIVPK